MPEQESVNLWELSDLRTPWCIRVAATLRIADRIASGVNQVEELVDMVVAEIDEGHHFRPGHLPDVAASAA